MQAYGSICYRSHWAVCCHLGTSPKGRPYTENTDYDDAEYYNNCPSETRRNYNNTRQSLIPSSKAYSISLCSLNLDDTKEDQWITQEFKLNDT